MSNNARFAEIASLAGDGTRAAILHALMDGRALTASELARAARVAAQTASGHLAKLSAAGLLCVEQQGRHRYFRLASSSVAQMVESIMRVASGGDTLRPALLTGPRDAALRMARTCYDHLAGRLGVALADALTRAGHVELAADGGLVTDSGLSLLQRIGIDVAALQAGRGRHARVLCRPCLDWSERRPHLAGALGAALCQLSLDQGWVRRSADTRAVTVTRRGRDTFCGLMGARLDGE